MLKMCISYYLAFPPLRYGEVVTGTCNILFVKMLNITFSKRVEQTPSGSTTVSDIRGLMTLLKVQVHRRILCNHSTVLLG